MTEAKKYTFAIEINPVEEGRVYKHMPLHCTIMHWFYVALTSRELALASKKAIEGQAPVELISNPAESYGPNRDIRVHPIVPVAELLSLHHSLYEVLHDMGVEYTHPQYVGSGYLPHVASRDGASFDAGSRHQARRMYLVEALDEETPPSKIVRHIIELN